MNAQTLASTQAGGFGARSTGLRLGALFGPAVFGVTAAGVALPDVAADLDATPAAVVWVLTAHALALGVGTALFGRLSDSWGVRNTMLAGALVLGLGALVCLLAPNLEALVAGRFVLAAGSGAMSACAVSLIAATPPAARPPVLARFGAAMAVCSAGATLAGGVLTDALTWRLTVVLPVLALLAVPFCLPLAAVRPGSGKPVDVVGAALLTVAASTFLVLIQSNTLELTTPIVSMVAAALVLAVLGLAWQIRRSPEGFVPRRLLADRTFLRAAAVGIGIYAGLFAAMYVTPQVLVREHGWSVLTVGTWLLPGALVGAALSRVAGRLAAGPGGSRLTALAAAAFAVFLALAGTAGGPALLVIGASLGFAAFSVAQVVITGLMSAHLPPAQRGGAMGLLNLAFFVGGGVGSAAAAELSRSMELASALALLAVLPLLAAALAVALTPSRAPHE